MTHLLRSVSCWRIKLPSATGLRIQPWPRYVLLDAARFLPRILSTKCSGLALLWSTHSPMGISDLPSFRYVLPKQMHVDKVFVHTIPGSDSWLCTICTGSSLPTVSDFWPLRKLLDGREGVHWLLFSFRSCRVRNIASTYFLSSLVYASILSERDQVCNPL